MSLTSMRTLLVAGLLGLLPTTALAGNVLSTNGFTSCMENSTIKVNNLDIKFDRSTNMVQFNVAGTSEKVQNVSASLEISAYGKSIYKNDFDPCGDKVHVPQLCPVPQGDFQAAGEYSIPQQYSDMIPGIAYTVPNLDGNSKMELKSADPAHKGDDVACIQSQVTNDKSFGLPAVSWITAGIAAAAAAASALSALAAAAGGSGTGTATSSPTFTEVILWFQGIAMNGMVDVQYPSTYVSFSKNFAWSGGLVGWSGMQHSIDSFRKSTGGNLTASSYGELQNSTLINQSPDSNGLQKRALIEELMNNVVLMARDGVQTSVNGSQTTVGAGPNPENHNPDKQQKFVTGVQYYAEQAMIPNNNVFMTVLLIFAIVLGGMAAGILLLKVILEAWALFGSFPKKLTSFRKNYWWILGKWTTNLIFMLYSVWVLYCVYQFKVGDSWAAKILAGVTLGIFTAILLGFTWKIWSMARKFKKAQGSASELYENKEVWRKYSIFYDNYKRGYWWLFVPAIIYMFAKGCVLATAGGHTSNHSLAQTAALLIVDAAFLVLLIILRPYNLKSGNWINIVIQVVRVLSVVCILVFVEKLGFSQTTKTVTGVALIVVQATLTGVLGILIAVNAIVNCVRMNPHRRARKEAQAKKDLDTLTPLDAHNSLLMYPVKEKAPITSNSEMVGAHARGRSQQGYDMLPLRDESSRLLSPSPTREPTMPTIGMAGAGHDRQRSMSPVGPRQPQLPDLDFGHPKTKPGMAL